MTLSVPYPLNRTCEVIHLAPYYIRILRKEGAKKLRWEPTLKEAGQTVGYFPQVFPFIQYLLVTKFSYALSKVWHIYRHALASDKRDIFFLIHRAL